MDVDFTTDHTVLNFNILLKMSEKPSVSRKVFNYKKTDVENLMRLRGSTPKLDICVEISQSQ